MFSLLPYQTTAVSAVYEKIRAGKRRIILQAPTGAGKTVMTAKIIHDAVIARGRRCWFLTHRQQLVRQASEKLSAEGIRHGIVMDGEATAPGELCQVACVASMLQPTRILPRLGEFDLIVVDEAHRADGDKLVDMLPQPLVLALTATPCDSAGRRMSDRFDDMVISASISELVATGALVAPRLFGPRIDDGMEATAVREALTRPSVLDHYISEMAAWESAKTVVFCSSIAHADKVGEELRAKGKKVAIVHSELGDREENMAAFEQGDAEFLVNASVLVEGWDYPPLHRVVMLRPTASLPVFLQQVGRGSRPWCHDCRGRPGPECKNHRVKRDWELWDYAGNVFRHLWPFMDRKWSLDGTDTTTASKAKAVGLWRCKHCFWLDERPHKTCPNCGQASPGRMMRLGRGTMTEYDPAEEQRLSAIAIANEAEKKRLGKLHQRLVGMLIYRGGMDRGRAGATAKTLVSANRGDEAKCVAAVASMIARRSA